MSHELICSWFGLPANAWPPDHYRLLGLNPGESDLSLIEQRVQQRLDSVRCYQMKHPEQATEAMTRLAQAFICLTEPASKKVYDAGLLGERPRPTPPPLPTYAPVVPPPLPASLLAAEGAPMDPLSWLYTRDAVGPGSASFVPPPVRVAPLALSAPVAVEAPPQVEELPPPAPLPEPEPIDPVIEAARSTPQVKRGLATRRAIFARLARTRELLILWGKLEKFVADPARRLSRTETAELRKQVEAFVEVLGDFPLFGEAGHPGYLIVALTDLDGVKTIQNLNTNQRESLRRDWVSGRKFLEAHRSYLRGEIRAMRSRGRLSHWIRACRAILNERPLYAALVLLGLVAVGVAVWKNAL